MKVNKDLLKKAASLFDNIEQDTLYVNNKGHFFTSKNLAENSVKSKKNVAVIERKEVAKIEAEDPKKDTGSGNETKTEFVAPSADELKAKGDELSGYLAGLKQPQLFAIREKLGLETKQVISNKDLAKAIIEELNK